MTILFYEDWKKYPTAIVDTQTKNRSFVRMAYILKQRGIKNHAFMLALYNPSLQGVNPHDPNLTAEQCLAVATECSNNFWYFIREVARVPADSGEDAIPLELNRGNLALYWSFLNHIMVFLIQIRQTGKSISTDMLMSWLVGIRARNTQINLLTKDDVLRSANIKRLKAIMDEFPYYLQFRTKADTNNNEVITVNRFKNSFIAHVAQASLKGAYKLGRGLTSPIFQIDEGPFQQNAKTAIGSALAASSAAVDRAKRAGKEYGTIFTTTAGKMDDPDGSYIYGLLQEAMVWEEALFDCESEDQLNKVIRSTSRNRVYRVNITLNHIQLGKTDEWLLSKIQESTQSGEDADRDFFNRWTNGTNQHPLEAWVLQEIRDSRRDTVYLEVDKVDSYVTRWYIPKDQIDEYMENNTFVLALDPSEGLGNDAIGFHLMNIERTDTTATGSYNELNLLDFARWLMQFLVKYKNVTCIIEARSSGRAIIDYLIRTLPEYGEDPFRRLFNLCVQFAEENQERYKQISQPMTRRDKHCYVAYKREFGFATSGGNGLTSRNELYGNLFQLAARQNGKRIYDETLINQISGLTKRNNRIDHAPGGHDDNVIAWLLCNWLLTNGKNLSHYGIDSSKIDYINSINRVKQLDPRTAYLQAEQKRIRERIHLLAEQAINARDQMVAMRLETEITMLSRKIVLEDNETFSLDDLINKLRKQRKDKQILRRAS